MSLLDHLLGQLVARFAARKGRSGFVAIWAGVLFMSAIPMAWGAGTVAGTTISNTATVSYFLGSTLQAEASGSVSFVVDEVIQPTVTWQDAEPVSVNSPDVNGVLTFLLTNSGNGQEAFALTRVNGPDPLPPGSYTPLDGSVGSIFLESGSLAGFQASGPNADVRYIPGTNDPVLSPDESLRIYVISDTPSVPVNSLGEVRLEAASQTEGVAGATPGTAFAGRGQGGGFAVAGIGGGRAAAVGRYRASGLGFAMSKSVVSVVDPNGTAVKMPNAVLTYQILVNLTGVGTVDNLEISDPLPAEVTYVPSSIAVDGVSKTDAVDSDNAHFDQGLNKIVVSLGSVAAPKTVVVTFQATIK